MDASILKTRILVVDDDEDYRILLRHHLERVGYEVIESSDGDKAYALLRSEPVRLVILDVVMPKTEGLETIMRLRREGFGAKILAVSGAGGATAYLKAAVLLGADAALDKTRPVTELLTVVEQCTEDANGVSAAKTRESTADKKY